MENIEIYKTPDGISQVEVKFEEESVWLSQQQMATLFEQTKQNISLHIRNCYNEGELEKQATVKEYLTVQKEGKRKVNRKIEYYNLDVIISVGYRVKSKRGTQFRQWATQRLKDFLVKGYAINQKRLDQLEKVVEVINKSSGNPALQVSETNGLLEILSRYTKSFIMLNKYDSNDLSNESLNSDITYEISYSEAKGAIQVLKQQLIDKNQANSIFGNEKDQGFKSSLQTIVQTFDGQYLYGSIEEQAANLLYFIVKNHSFTDGNKRIGAFLFIWFLEKNKYSLKTSGELKINDNGLTALTLLIAQSDPAEKELMVQLVVNLINE
ncbi:virulence protein RhuM/Fic/DOC family protein [Zunongwangia sp. F260]|uniref:Virulence protein RhuM/Fic/DOC family protein n=1 Tax=Autumnicola lenta TaxID=3075593 RepID=A0ABU3CNM7_9FLAO|nr:virulence protein RhuM/Fic/DOC family protein [Zunongwangia sp. F260]MDT0647961.1 virulence protein RhuM/Fic/DOC family protein [Zunongwangia sp. F260]